MVARVLYGLCSFLAVLRVDDDFADAFRNRDQAIAANAASAPRSEEHTSELQSLMRISYAVFCLKKKNKNKNHKNTQTINKYQNNVRYQHNQHRTLILQTVNTTRTYTQI